MPAGLQSGTRLALRRRFVSVAAVNIAVVVAAAAAAVADPSTSAIGELANVTVDYIPASMGDCYSTAVVDHLQPVFGWVVPTGAASETPGEKRLIRPNAVELSGYRIWVAAEQQEQSIPGRDIDDQSPVSWDSGWVASNASRARYQGSVLKPDTSYSIRISASLTDGERLEGEGKFSTGLLLQNRSAWGGANWIAGAAWGAPRRNYLRTIWELPPGTLRSASAMVAGIGYHELYCNGVQLGLPGAKLQPGYTNFEKRTYYVRYNMTGCLKSGFKNVVGVVLGNGWYSQGEPTVHSAKGVTGMPGARQSPPQLLFRGRTTIAGKQYMLLSDAMKSSAWHASAGPIVYDSLYDGEIYDARLALDDAKGRHFSHPDWDGDRATWKPAVPLATIPDHTKLTPQIIPPIRRLRHLPARSIHALKKNMHVIDFGQNTAGIVRFRIPAGMKKGSNITVSHAELLQHPPYGPADGSIYVGNLRDAKATDVYIASGSESGTTHYEPTFTQHGFRYICVSGWPQVPALQDFMSIELHTSVTETGQFLSSSKLLNSIQTNCQWTARSNLMSIPTDCCQRNERRGWMGDAALGASVNIYNHDMHTFYSAFADMMVDDQGKAIDGDEEGAMPNWVPVFGPKFPGAGAPNWMTAYPTIIHTVWRHTGDTDLLRKHWPHLEAYIKWFDRKYMAFPDFRKNPFRRTAEGAISDTQFPGDWCPPPQSHDGSIWHQTDLNLTEQRSSGLGEAECGHTGWNNRTVGEHGSVYTPPALFTSKLLSSAFAYLKDRQHVAAMGAAIGESLEEIDGITSWPALKAAFNRAFLNQSVDGEQQTVHYGSGGASAQSEQAMPLLLKAPPSTEISRAVASFLAEDLSIRHHNHSTSGIVGLRALYEVLPKLGRADLALATLLRTDYPSFGYQIQNENEPATTIWEVYDADVEGSSMASRNHVMFATPSYFLFSSVAGIEPLVPGDQLWQVAPAVVGVDTALNSASATVWTPKGFLSAGWSLLNSDEAISITNASVWKLHMNLTVPVGLRVQASLPLPSHHQNLATTCDVLLSSGSLPSQYVWRAGAFIPSNTSGVFSAAVTNDARAAAVTILCGSGFFDLLLSCA